MTNIPQEILDQINDSPIITALLTPSNDGKFACPFCGSGTGEHGTSAVSIHAMQGGTNPDSILTCHSCGESARNMKLAAHCLGLDANKDFRQVAKFCCDSLGIAWQWGNVETFDEKTLSILQKPKALPKEHSTSGAEKPQTNYAEKFYPYAQSQMQQFIESQGGTFRGLDLDDWQSVGAGFAVDKESKRGFLILPYNDFQYFKRSVDNVPEKISRFSGGTRPIYNPFKIPLDGAEIPYFIVEGEIDCASICVLKFHHPNYFGGCVAIGSTTNWKKFLRHLKGEGITGAKFIVLFDNKTANDVGIKSGAEFVDAANKEGHFAIQRFLNDEGDDANSLFQKDKWLLLSRIIEIQAECKSVFEQMKADRELDAEKAKVDLTKGTPLFYFSKYLYEDSTKTDARYSNLKTGFSNLDKVQDEYAAGIYVLGGLPGAGKSTFAWQLLEQIARQKDSDGNYRNHCVFITFEMSQEAFFAKTYARAVGEYQGLPYYCNSENFDKGGKKPLTAAQIRKGKVKDSAYFPSFKKQIEISSALKEIDLRILDYSKNRVKVEELIQTMQGISDDIPADEPLIFCIDYLQIMIDGTIENRRVEIDSALQKLNQFAQKNNAMILIISSFSRAAYGSSRDEISLGLFKESGAIEYCASMIWTLSLVPINENGFASSGSEAADIARAAEMTPRPVKLRCLKNRYGGFYACFFKYYSAVDAFAVDEDPDYLTGK